MKTIINSKKSFRVNNIPKKIFSTLASLLFLGLLNLQHLLHNLLLLHQKGPNDPKQKEMVSGKTETEGIHTLTD